MLQGISKFPDAQTFLDLPNTEIRGIIDDYLASLEIPETKPKTQFLLCPVGLVGSGKSTILKVLSKELCLIRHEGDAIRKILRSKNYNFKRFPEISTIINENLLSQGHSISLDSDCVAIKETVDGLSKKYDLKVVWIHVDPPEEFIVSRIKARDHAGLFRTTEDALKTYYARKPLHENLDFPFVCRIDTSRENLQEQLEATKEIIAAKLAQI